MPNNIQNNNRSWKQRLDELDWSENEMPDQAVLLEKLHRRMELQPKKRMLQQWLVAATVIGLLFIPASLREIKQNALGRSPIENAVNEHVFIKSTAVAPVNTAAAVNLKKEKSRVTSPGDKKIQRLPEPISAKEKTAAHPFDINSSSITVRKEIPDSIFNRAITAGDKKQLKVIHFNELPGESPSTLEIIPYRKYIRRPAAAVGRKNSSGIDHILVDF